MGSIRQYILSLCAAAMICGIIKSLSDKMGASSKMIQALCGVFLTITAIRPLLSFQISDISNVSWPYHTEAEKITTDALREAEEARDTIIIDQLKAYIMDKAASLGAQIDVEILLTEENNSLPCGDNQRKHISLWKKEAGRNTGVRSRD